MKKRILVATSGGVDSAVAAALLKEAGAEVEAVYMRTWQSEDGLGDCPWRDDLESARGVAEHLSVPFRILNMIDDYRRFIVEDLIAGYRSGRTPNPDMLCNRFIKFGALVDYALREGFDFLATGHYCRIERSPMELSVDETGPKLAKSLTNRRASTDQPVTIWEGIDAGKDQSYFLALVRREKLARVLFPLGTLKKSTVRQLAKERGLPNAARKDSQDICFLGGKVSIQRFLDRFIPPKKGPIVDRFGKVLGAHQGLHHYTIGQRHGIGIPSNCDFEKYVVVGKDLAGNRLIVAFESDPENGLWTSTARVHELNFIGPIEVGKRDLMLRVRYRDRPTEGEVDFRDDGTATVKFCHPQRAIAVGQTLAFYRDRNLLGGGIFF